ncbi:DUF2759 domain-containing protein [Bacillus badius]|uniref:YqgW n=1 Tax=Bacillus badius TaxID=1455 RepID=A0ABR5AYA5_BACBA|nr:DUF2759 domain-containing protein [Bacillus badius]KIL75296.1 YqgW [Bacillus badius]KIL79716.1 YqgW [Bacillus badius]MED0664754.1 DUF2759 domain-containing protein [Bacillus badius]MED4715192.1 DUF2759 domain-containing protein [Bacillus badius]OCS83770.1 DUF2759 domain-containing protein [Bacillus badius]
MNGLVIIFALVALLALFSTVSALKNKNLLGIIFGLGTLGVFGWFTVMTVIHQGYPAG